MTESQRVEEQEWLGSHDKNGVPMWLKKSNWGQPQSYQSSYQPSVIQQNQVRVNIHNIQYPTNVSESTYLCMNAPVYAPVAPRLIYRTPMLQRFRAYGMEGLDAEERKAFRWLTWRVLRDQLYPRHGHMNAIWLTSREAQWPLVVALFNEAGCKANMEPVTEWMEVAFPKTWLYYDVNERYRFLIESGIINTAQSFDDLELRLAELWVMHKFDRTYQSYVYCYEGDFMINVPYAECNPRALVYLFSTIGVHLIESKGSFWHNPQGQYVCTEEFMTFRYEPQGMRNDNAMNYLKGY